MSQSIDVQPQNQWRLDQSVRLDSRSAALAVGVLVAFAVAITVIANLEPDLAGLAGLVIACLCLFVSALELGIWWNNSRARIDTLTAAATTLFAATGCVLATNARTVDELALVAALILATSGAFWMTTHGRSLLRYPSFGITAITVGFVLATTVILIKGWSSWLASDADALLMAALAPLVVVAMLCKRPTTQVLAGASLLIAILLVTEKVDPGPVPVGLSALALTIAVVLDGGQGRQTAVISGIDLTVGSLSAAVFFGLGVFSLDDPVRSFAFGSSLTLCAVAFYGSRLLIHERERRVAELLDLNATIEDLARLDHLTGLPNRAALEQRLLEEVERAVRYRHPMSICFVDIDHFKSVNDTLGHSAGDVLLQQIAAVIRTTLRTPDFVARYGGEEFVVIAPGTWTADATMLGTRIQNAIEIEVDHLLGRPVTVSIGIAGVPEHGTTADEVLERADSALYAAKRGGRNRVEIAQGVPDSPAP